ncbi:hypothetical protein [Carnimonas bestiolae]|uniref:hypothetical protein n=1 Tax=Carnimonas bestiolae TaxID=3402172 RepID=UPI003EDC2701
MSKIVSADFIQSSDEKSKIDVKEIDRVVEAFRGRGIDARELGLEDGGNIIDIFKQVQNYPNTSIFIPSGNYRWEGQAGPRYLNEGKYKIVFDNDVKITCAEEDSGTHYMIRYYGGFRGMDTSVARFSDAEKQGQLTSLSSETRIGSKYIEVESLPNGVSVGDSVYLTTTRLSLGENRSYYREGQVSKIREIDGNRITLAEGALFDYAVNRTVKGSATGNFSKHGNFIKIPVEFDSEDGDVNYDDYRGTVKFSGGNVGNVCAVDRNKKCLWIGYGHLNSDDVSFDKEIKEGESFTITHNSYVAFAAPVEIEMLGRAEFIYDYQNSSASSFLFDIRNVQNLTIDGLRCAYFDQGLVQASQCYCGQIKNTISDGSVLASKGSGIASGTIGLLDSSYFEIFDNIFYGFNQAVNIQGNHQSSCSNVIRNNRYVGGCSYADGTVSAPNGDSGWTSGIGCEHGGAYLNKWSNNIIHNGSRVFNTMRGRESIIENNIIYGATDCIIYAWAFTGLTVRGNKYFSAGDSFNETTDYGTRKSKTIPQAFLRIDSTPYDGNRPDTLVTIEDNYMSDLSGQFLSMGTDDQEGNRAVYYSYCYDNNTVGSVTGINNNKVMLVGGHPSGNGVFYTHGWYNGTNNKIVHKRGDGFDFYWNGRNFMRSQLVPNTFEPYGQDAYYVSVDPDTSVKIFLTTARRAIILDMLHETSVDIQMSGCLITKGSASIKGGYKSDKVMGSNVPLLGTTGKENSFNVSLLEVDENDEVGKSNLLCLYLENRMSSNFVMKVIIR